MTDGGYEMIEKEFTVQEKHSAAVMGSGDLAVLSTPSLIAFMENVAKKEAQAQIANEETTVGIELNMQHLKATAIGKTVKVTAGLVEQKKTILTYEVQAFEDETLIGKGIHKRAIVNAKRFMGNL